jgi:hypothetical protein
MNYFKLWDKLQMEEPYTRVEPPVKYQLQDYRSLISSKPNSVSGENEKASNYALRPIEDEDMMRYASKDDSWLDQYSGVRDMGDGLKAPMSRPFLGPEMTDAEFKKWTGMTW